ncbi:MAG: hypothetical protein GWP14_05985 [Actinobacteria bacterium]|nr:hypothetical protein [Actinomycetota bacterium]
MMSVRFVLGRAGAGKTRHCLESIRAALKGNPLGPALILLVPEQATAQMERALLDGENLKGTFRAQVLSFRRLAYKVLAGTGRIAEIIPSVTERMILRHILNEHKSELKVYGAVTDRAGLVNKLLENLKELISERAEPAELQEAAEKTGNQQLTAKAFDLALLLESYQQYVDRHGLERTSALDELPSRIEQAEFLRQAHIWVDGFAGFTKQETEVLIALAKCSAAIDICLLTDPESRLSKPSNDPLRLFSQTEQTYHKLSESLAQAGVSISKQPLGLSNSSASIPAELKQLEANLFRRNRLCPEGCGAISRIRLVEAAEHRSEVDGVVREILRLTRRKDDPLRYRDIAVIVRNFSAYHDLLASSLGEHGIPFFIDRRYNLSHHALVELLRNALALLIEDFSLQSIRGLLKTGLLGIDQQELDRLENYILAQGIKVGSSWQGEDWKHSGHIILPGDVEDATADKEEDLAKINATRQKLLRQLGQWCQWSNGSGQARKVRDWVQSIVELLERLKVPEQLSNWADEAKSEGRDELAEQHRRAWECLVELLGQMVEVLGNEQITLTELTDILNAGMAEFSLGLVPPKLDQVLIGSVERSRHPSLRAAFVIGMNEGVFPRSISEDSVLSDRERELLDSQNVRLGPTAEELFFRERLLAYIAMTRPQDYLWVSYAAADQTGKTLNPSPFVAEVLRAVPGLKTDRLAGSTEPADPALAGTTARLAASVAGQFRAGLDELPERISKRWLSAYRWLIERGKSGATKKILLSLVYRNTPHLEPRTRAKLLGQTIRTSKTALESFAACPFQHFASRLLELAEREDASVRDVDLGRLYHRAMEKLGQELIQARSRLGDMDREKAVERIRDISSNLVKKLAETEPALKIGRNQFLADYMRKHLCDAVEAGHLRSEVGRLYPVAVEQKFGIDEKSNSWPALSFVLGKRRTLELRGIIDLLELAEGSEPKEHVRYAVVYDYKRSRERKFELSKAYYGLDLQLLIYLLVVRELGPKALDFKAIEPVGGFYVSLKGPTISKAKPGEKPNEDDSLSRSRPRGLFRTDRLPLIDNTECGALRAVHGTVNKDGSLRKGQGDWLDAEDFETVLEYAAKKIRGLAHEILNGKIGIEPYRLGQHVPCTYCVFHSVCRVEPLTRPYREMKTLKKDQAIEQMRQHK